MRELLEVGDSGDFHGGCFVDLRITEPAALARKLAQSAAQCRAIGADAAAPYRGFGRSIVRHARRRLTKPRRGPLDASFPSLFWRMVAVPLQAANRSKAAKMSTILDVYLENEAALKRFLRRFIKTREDVDDLAQECFLRAFAAESDHSIKSPKAFLYTVAKNLALNELARRANAAVESLGDSNDQDVLEDESRVAVDDEVDGRERIRQLARAIASLPPQCSKVFILRKMQGLSHKEIASRLNISVRTVENHIALGLLRCKAYLRANGGLPGGEVSGADGVAPTAVSRLTKVENSVSGSKA